MHVAGTRSNLAPAKRRRRLARGLLALVFARGRSVHRADGQLPRAGIHRILICRVTHTLGNTLLLTPLIAELQAIYPGAEIDVVARSEAAERIFGGFRSVRHVFRLPAHAGSHPLAVLGAIVRMRGTRYDLVIDPDRNSQTGRLLLLLARGDRKLGFAGEKAGTLTHGVPPPDAVMHAGHLPVHLLRSAAGMPAAAPFPLLHLGLDAQERCRGANALREILATADAGAAGKPVIGIFANATGHKFLGADWWQRFAGELEARLPDHAIVEIVPASGHSLLAERYPAYYSSDIRRLAGLLSALERLVSADCGIMHLACASGTPVTAMFSVTDPAEWGPYGPDDRVVSVRDRTPEAAAAIVAQP